MAATTVRTPNSYVKENSASDMVWKPDSAYPHSNNSLSPTSTWDNNSTWSERNKRDTASTPREPLRPTVSLLSKYTTKPRGKPVFSNSYWKHQQAILHHKQQLLLILVLQQSCGGAPNIKVLKFLHEKIF